MARPWKQSLTDIVCLAMLYALIGNARSIQENPFIPGAVIAVSMVIPVVAGIIFGPRVGAGAGFLGTLLNALIYQFVSPPRAVFEFLAIIPHTIMGAVAGSLRGKIPTPFIAPTIAIGHVLNVLAFVSFGVLAKEDAMTRVFWLGLGYETLVGMVTIIVIITMLRIGFPLRRT